MTYTHELRSTLHGTETSDTQKQELHLCYESVRRQKCIINRSTVDRYKIDGRPTRHYVIRQPEGSCTSVKQMSRDATRWHQCVARTHSRGYQTSLIWTSLTRKTHNCNLTDGVLTTGILATKSYSDNSQLEGWQLRNQTLIQRMHYVKYSQYSNMSWFYNI